MAITPANLYNTTGIRIPTGACVIIVRTEWNAASVNKLEEGCCKVLDEHGVKHSTVVVPGAFEIPFAIKNYWDKHKYKDDRPHAFMVLCN
jgi:6,7-dimethyl-8-ribityllumazine synthase